MEGSSSASLPLPLNAVVESQTFDGGDVLSTQKITRKGQSRHQTLFNPKKTSIRQLAGSGSDSTFCPPTGNCRALAADP